MIKFSSRSFGISASISDRPHGGPPQRSKATSLLNSVRIQRFKSVTDATVKLGRVTLLVGPNNAGKSSVLQAIQFGVSIAQSLHLDGTGRWSGPTLSGTLATQQLVYTPLQDVHALATGGSLRQKVNTISVTFETDDDGSAEVEAKRGRNKNIAVTMTGKKLIDRLQDMDNPFSVVAPGLAGIPSFEEFKARGVVTRAAARGDANSVFRNVLLTLSRDAAAWSKFESSLAEIFPEVIVKIRFNEKTDEQITATVSRGGYELPIDSSGTGVLQAIQVLAYVGVYKPKLLILDEPDSHLHPDNQRKLAKLLTDLAVAEDFQVLISSHSRHFLDEFASLGALVTWFSSGAAQDGVFDHVRALLELGALDAGDRLRNGQTPVIVITEDTDTKFLKVLLESSGLTNSEYDIWSYAGSSDIASARILSKFISDHAPGTKVLVHRDSDYLSDDALEVYRLELEEAGAVLFRTEGTDIESYFLRPDHLAAVYPTLDRAVVDDVIEKANEHVREKSVELIITARSEQARAEQRRTGGGKKSDGQIAQAATTEYELNPSRFRHGKRTLGAVRNLMQTEHRLSESPIISSSALSLPEISAIADAIRQ